MVSRAEDPENARTVYPEMWKTWCVRVAQAIATNKRTQQQYNQSQMKPTGGATPSWLLQVMRIWHAKRWSERRVLPKLPIRLKPIWTSKAVS